MILILDTEFTDFTADKALLSLALLSTDGAHEFYGERSDVSLKLCSEFTRASVLPLMTAEPPVSGDLQNLRTRLRSFIDALPEQATIATDSWTDLGLLTETLGRPWPERLNRKHMDLRDWASTPTFEDAQARYHQAGRPYHHALHDVRGMRAGYLAWCHHPQSTFRA